MCFLKSVLTQRSHTLLFIVTEITMLNVKHGPRPINPLTLGSLATSSLLSLLFLIIIIYSKSSCLQGEREIAGVRWTSLYFPVSCLQIHHILPKANSLTALSFRYFPNLRGLLNQLSHFFSIPPEVLHFIVYNVSLSRLQLLLLLKASSFHHHGATLTQQLWEVDDFICIFQMRKLRHREVISPKLYSNWMTTTSCTKVGKPSCSCSWLDSMLMIHHQFTQF